MRVGRPVKIQYVAGHDLSMRVRRLNRTVITDNNQGAVMGSTLQRLIASNIPQSPPWSSADALATANYRIALDFLVFSIQTLRVHPDQGAPLPSSAAEWSRDLLEQRLNQARRCQVLRAYFHESETDRKGERVVQALQVSGLTGGDRSADEDVVARWIDVFERSQPARALDRSFRYPLQRTVDIHHPVHRLLKSRYPSDSKFPVVAARTLLAAMRHWGGNVTAGRGAGIDRESDPWLEPIPARVGVKELGQCVVPYFLEIARRERPRCPVQVGGAMAGKSGANGRRINPKKDEVALPDEVQAVFRAYLSRKQPLSRKRFVSEVERPLVFPMSREAHGVEGPVFWFDGDVLCFRVREHEMRAICWIEAYVLDAYGGEVTVCLSEADGVYMIELSIPGDASAVDWSQRVEWVGMTPLDGGLNEAIVVLLRGS